MFRVLHSFQPDIFLLKGLISSLIVYFFYCQSRSFDRERSSLNFPFFFFLFFFFINKPLGLSSFITECPDLRLRVGLTLPLALSGTPKGERHGSFCKIHGNDLLRTKE